MKMKKSGLRNMIREEVKNHLLEYRDYAETVDEEIRMHLADVKSLLDDAVLDFKKGVRLTGEVTSSISSLLGKKQILDANELDQIVSKARKIIDISDELNQSLGEMKIYISDIEDLIEGDYDFEGRAEGEQEKFWS